MPPSFSPRSHLFAGSAVSGRVRVRTLQVRPLLQVVVLLIVIPLTAVTARVTPVATMPLVTTTMEIAAAVDPPPLSTLLRTQLLTPLLQVFVLLDV